MRSILKAFSSRTARTKRPSSTRSGEAKHGKTTFIGKDVNEEELVTAAIVVGMHAAVESDVAVQKESDASARKEYEQFRNGP